MRIDLHTHSTVSDGTQSPAELMASAVDAGLDVVALTDHDSFAGWDEASAAADSLGITMLAGVEISCEAGGIGIHLLGYRPDPHDPDLLDELNRIRRDRYTRAERMVARIARDYPITFDDVLQQAPDGATVGRPHIADALVARGHVADRDEAFAGILRNGSPYYVRHYALEAHRAVQLVRRAGGVPVMAHPRAGRRGRVVSDAVIADLAKAGLAGLETDHRDHTAAERAELRELADRLGVFVTGSSDYHGAGKQNQLGENLTSPEVYEQILTRSRKAA